MRTNVEWLCRGLAVGLSLGCLGYSSSLYAEGCEARPTKVLPHIAGAENVREVKYIGEAYTENEGCAEDRESEENVNRKNFTDGADNANLAEDMNTTNNADGETTYEGYTKWRLMPKKMICFKPVEVKPIELPRLCLPKPVFKPIQMPRLCLPKPVFKPVQMPQLCLPKPVFKPVQMPSMKSLFVCPRCQALACQCGSSGCEAEEDVAPSGCEAEEDVAPSGCEAEEGVAPSGCEAEEDVAPSGCEAEEGVAPSGCEAECVVKPLPCPGVKLISGMFRPKMISIPVPALLCPPVCEASNEACGETDCD